MGNTVKGHWKYTVKEHWKTPRRRFKHTRIPIHWVDNKGRKHLKNP